MTRPNNCCEGDYLVYTDKAYCIMRVAKGEGGVPITHHVEFLNEITYHGEHF